MVTKRAEPHQESVSERRTSATAAGMRATPVTAPPDAAKVLQRRFGNQGTQALLRARIGGEHAGPAVKVPRPAIEGSSGTPTLQTFSRDAISRPGDTLEREAERVADQVMRMRQPAAPVATARASVLQRSAAGAAVGETVPPIVHDVLRSPGQPLDRATRAFMEPRFGQDFGGVRIHTGAKAHEAASSIDARAFTSNGSIAFGAGEYAPQTQSGRRLLAHELTHVVQQRPGAVQPKLGIGDATDRYEQEADRVAEAVVQTSQNGMPVAAAPAHEIRRQTAAKKSGSESKSPPLEKRVGQVEKQQNRQGNMIESMLQFLWFTNTVLKTAWGWHLAAENLGAAYALAASRHNAAIEAREKAEALKTQLLFSVLTVASSGTLSWLSELATAKEVMLLSQTLEDTVQAGLGEAFSAVGPMLKKTGLGSVSQDPLQYRAKLVGRVEAAIVAAQGYFADVSLGLRTSPPEFWDTYDGKAQMQKYNGWLKQADLLGSGANLPALEIMADELERGFWHLWLPGLATTKVRMREPYEMYTAYESPGSAVEDRLSALGVFKKGYFGIWTFDIEVQEMIDWAKGYQVKRFVK